jgi:hypothetical protein
MSLSDRLGEQWRNFEAVCPSLAQDAGFIQRMHSVYADVLDLPDDLAISKFGNFLVGAANSSIMSDINQQLVIDGIRAARPAAAPAAPSYTPEQQALIDQAEVDADFEAEVRTQNFMNRHAPLPGESPDDFAHRMRTTVMGEYRQRENAKQAQLLSRLPQFGGTVDEDQEARNRAIDEQIAFDEREKERLTPGYLAQRQLIGETTSALYANPDKSRFYAAQVPAKK